jgi:hypothetical protein
VHELVGRYRQVRAGGGGDACRRAEGLTARAVGYRNHVPAYRKTLNDVVFAQRYRSAQIALLYR